jgi:hypothetical protein
MEVSGQLHVPAALPPGKEPPVSTGYEAGWAPGMVRTLWNGERNLALAENASRYNAP